MQNKTATLNSSSTPHILVVDDEHDIRHLLKEILEDEGFNVTVAENAETARQAYIQHQPSLILLDIWMPDVDGITLLKEWNENGNLSMPVIMMSGHGNVETAVEATRLGAFDFIEKPLSLAKLLLTVEHALESNIAQNESKNTSSTASARELTGRSSVMQRLRDQTKRIAEHDSNVLIQGEAGSGVKLAAQFIHTSSQRHNKNFIEINFSSSNFNKGAENFLENSQSQSLLSKAQNGTLYLRNIDEADNAAQKFLLALLQTSSFQLFGSSSTIEFNARIICSTHRDIEKLVEEDLFRKDLYYLINVVPLYIPSLREHREDIPDLLNFYTNVFIEKENLPYRHFSLAAQNHLRNHKWLGNIKELTNLIQHLLITSSGNEITLEDVESAITLKNKITPAKESISIAYDLPLREAREQFERDYLIHQLIKTGGSVGKVAKIIEMERTHLYRKLRALEIDPKAVITDNT